MLGAGDMRERFSEEMPRQLRPRKGSNWDAKPWKGCSRQREEQKLRCGGTSASGTLGDSELQLKEGLRGGQRG